MAELLEIEEVAFKPQAYEKAARSIEDMSESIEDIYKKGGTKVLEKIPGVGEGIAERIEEYLKTEKIKDYDKLKKKIPVDVLELSSIEGIGPKLIKLFYDELKVCSIDDLEKAALAGKIAKLPRVGEKTEQKILKGIEFYKKSHKRFLLSEALEVAEKIKNNLEDLDEVEKICLAGSLRRQKETIGDLDILVSCKKSDAAEIVRRFISMLEVDYVYGKGIKKTSVRLEKGLDVDLRMVEKKSFGAALLYFTGSKEHNIALRKIAIEKGYKLNEYGIFDDEKIIAGKVEEEIYNKLGLDWVAPEMRENKGEIELALRQTQDGLKSKLPKLIEQQDIKGDLQIQTNWSDGANTIEEYAKESQKFGYEYILITDHTKGLAMIGGLDEKELIKQGKEIDKINKKLEVKSYKLKVLKGAEVNILKDGTLDIEDEVLEQLDIVGAAVHFNLNLSKKEQTERIIKAMENPHVDIIFHPTTRSLQKRPEMQLDMNEIFKVAKRTGTILEIDAYPTRLDLRDDYIMRAREVGVMLSIDTDAHAVSHLDFMGLGIGQARRGWCEKKHVVNTLSLEKILELFKKKKKDRF